MDRFPLPQVLWAQEQLGKSGPTGSTKIITTPALSTAIPAVVGQIAAAPNLTWTKSGTVIALYAQERSGTTAKFAQTELQIQFSGDEFFVTDGTGPTFAPLLALVGPNVNWFSMLRRVTQGDTWAVSYRNMDPTPATADPSSLFGFIADSDLPQLQAEYDQAMQRQRQARGG